MATPYFYDVQTGVGARGPEPEGLVENRWLTLLVVVILCAGASACG